MRRGRRAEAAQTPAREKFPARSSGTEQEIAQGNGATNHVAAVGAKPSTKTSRRAGAGDGPPSAETPCQRREYRQRELAQRTPRTCRTTLGVALSAQFTCAGNKKQLAGADGGAPKDRWNRFARKKCASKARGARDGAGVRRPPACASTLVDDTLRMARPKARRFPRRNVANLKIERGAANESEREHLRQIMPRGVECPARRFDCRISPALLTGEELRLLPTRQYHELNRGSNRWGPINMMALEEYNEMRAAF